MAIPIHTSRLILRDFYPEDWLEVHRYAGDPEVVKFMNWGPNSEADTKAFIAQAIAQSLERPRRCYHLAVALKATGQVIGGATLRMLDLEPDAGELGYTLHPQAWGQGFATELARALIEYGFTELQLRRIWATCRPDNIASFKVLRKLGLHFEEYLQHEKIIRGHWVDSLLCGLSQEAWSQNSINELERLAEPPANSPDR